MAYARGGGHLPYPVYCDDFGRSISKEEFERMTSYDTRSQRPEPPAKRAGHVMRDRYVDHLSNMMAEGFIDVDEYTERRDKAMATKHENELMVLVADLEPLPRAEPPKMTGDLKYHACCGFEDTRFRMWPWASCIALFSSLTILTGPLMAALFHGFDNAPLDGALPIFMVIAGVIGLLVTGIGLAPGETKYLVRLTPERREKYRKYAE